MESSRGPGQRAGLTRDGILEAASVLLAERGSQGLTMRAVAMELGVAPNAIYSHIAGKAALVDGVLDRTLARIEAPPPDAGLDPVAALHTLMSSTYEVLLANAGLVPVYLARQGANGANARRLGDVMLAHLAAAGVKDAAAREALRVLIVYTIGFAAFTTGRPAEAGDEAETDAVGPLPPAELHTNFDSGLRWLLAGITSAPAG